MIEGRCATCQWWDREDSLSQRPPDAWPPGREGDEIHGCRRTETVDNYRPDGDGWASEALAYGYAYGEGWRMCVLWTTEHFGCVQWEAKE